MAKKQKSRSGNSFGSWAFLIGVILAIVVAVLSTPYIQTWMLWVLLVIGLLVGLLNITEKESGSFMMSGTVLIIASALGQGSFSPIPVLSRLLDTLLLVFVPAIIVVAVRSVFSLARN